MPPNGFRRDVTVETLPSAPSTLTFLLKERGGAGGGGKVRNPKVCAPEMAHIDSYFCNGGVKGKEGIPPLQPSEIQIHPWGHSCRMLKRHT